MTKIFLIVWISSYYGPGLTVVEFDDMLSCLAAGNAMTEKHVVVGNLYGRLLFVCAPKSSPQ